MELNSVLDVMARYSDALGLTRPDLYELLFQGNGIEPQKDIVQTAKNIFSKGSNRRALTQKIMENILFEDGDVILREYIRQKWLSKVGCHKAIYDELCEQITADEFLPDQLKQALIACCDPSHDDQLAHFITLCIICGNYNTIQKKSGQPKVSEEYGINLTTLSKGSVFSCIEQQLWECSQREFLASRKNGGRFATLNIIQSILPKGYLVKPNFPARYRTPDGSINPVIDICKSSIKNIAIVGEGGIGKTTFLHQLMCEEFLTKNEKERKYRTGRPIPFFIELNRCPEQIQNWYDDTLGKTNFITRYIGQLYENHKAIHSVDDEILCMIEKEFQRTPEDNIPRYLLLLDGFNEVKSSKSLSVRTMLSHEISVLNTYPNIRIITTSRETQAAYYAADFENVQLIGLEDNDIRLYFEQSNIDEVLIGIYMSNKALLNCLRIPLFLCMFTAENVTDLIPETPGEILYHFFHRNSCFYNIRQHAADTRTNPLNVYQTSFVLDFILPYIGWQFEQKDSFSMNQTDFERLICDSVPCIRSLCTDVRQIPFRDFDYQPNILLQTADSLYDNGNLNVSGIINCIHGYLGILYQYQESTGDFSERNRYAFIHHHFRDYFSAIWDVQLLWLLQCIRSEQFFQSRGEIDASKNYHDFLNTHYWPHHKVEFISQILMEHRNRPMFNSDTENWYLPESKTDEQQVLEHALDYCRELCALEYDIHYLLRNILSSILQGREELSGLNLSHLDFKYCNFFNITCSKKGSTETLAACFDGATLYAKNFLPEEHQDAIIDYVYHGMQCFTLDMNGCIKCWDVLSGKLEYELSSKDPTGIIDFSPTGFLKISPDGNYLAIKQQESLSDGIHVSINLYHLSYPEKSCVALIPSGKHKVLNSFSFTGDSRGLLMVCDSKTVYGFSLIDQSICYCHTYENLLSETQLYADNTNAPIFCFTAEYNVYEWEYDHTHLIDEDEYSEEDDDDDDYLPIPCLLAKLSIKDNTSQIMYSFTGMPQTMPIAKFIPENSSFLLFNYESMQIEQYFCENGKIRFLFENLTKENNMPPCAIHIHPERAGEYYFMYPKNCYLTNISASRFSVLMKYPADGINKLLSNVDQEHTISFKTCVVPTNNRFIVGTDTNVYEWNSEEDTLFLKYNTAYYNCTDLISDPDRKRFMLIHLYNGVSVFEGSPLKLTNSYCFSDRDFFISSCCYEPNLQLLALNFSREDHERILLLNMQTGQQSVCFSTIYKNESVCNMCFDNTGEWLLIATQYRCLEYRLSTNTYNSIHKSSDNERIAGAYYIDKYIEIAFVEDCINGSCHVEDRCEFYLRKRMKEETYYQSVWGYFLPELTNRLLPYFIPQHGDLGTTGAQYKNGMQAYWVTRGFFLEKNRLRIPLPKCYKIKGNKQIPIQEPPIALDFLFYKHKHEISKHRNDDIGLSYTYLSDDKKQAIFLKNSCYLFLHNDYSHCTYEELEDGFKKKLGSYNGYACWEFAIPWENSDVIACYENFRLLRLNANTGAEMQRLEYTPGFAICGCSFSGIKVESELKEELQLNGGIL